jgi:hypothetical protein
MLSNPVHIKDIDGYIFFSDNTKGMSGKPIKIHTSLFIDFFRAVDPGTHDGQAVIRDIESLKAKAKANVIATLPAPKNRQSPAHIKQMSKLHKINNVMAGRRECSLITRNVRAYYHIDQKDDDNCSTVYISEVQVISDAVAKIGGLYDEKGGRGGLNELVKVDKVNLEGRSLFVSGSKESPKKAMEDAQVLTNKMNPAIFFNPPSIADDLGIGKAKRLSPSTKKVIQELERTIKDNQRKNVHWVVQGEGAAVLSHALNSVSGNLEKHSFKFSNAKADLPNLLGKLNDKKAQMKGEFIDYSSDKIALLAIADKNSELLKRMSELPKTSGYEVISRRLLMGQLKSLGTMGPANSALSQPQLLRGGTTTFVSALKTFMVGKR